MTGQQQRKPFTLRERRGVFVPLGIWAFVTVLATLTGPFETYRLLPLLPRLAYWALVAAVSVLMDMAFRVGVGERALIWRLGVRLGFAVALAGVLHLINAAVFDGWRGWEALIWLVGVIWVVAMVIEGLVAILKALHPTPETFSAPQSDPPDALFQRRLPFDRRGALIRLEAQDHYLKVVTDAGEAMILLRLSDAEADLDGFDGLRVHRSHWVAVGQVQKVIKRDGRLFLTMRDGAEVPVSRSLKAAANAAGLTA